MKKRYYCVRERDIKGCSAVWLVKLAIRNRKIVLIAKLRKLKENLLSSI
ncbi:hypothetical protein B0S90_1233 [Caldicellulosiruptor bescii]|uniref:Uncharacterized protein n=2 Tax=Caldicellulosiruptor bescii TaxID=31899 RepID=B9MQU6_CALBD|nr:hypothetical protein [Caldicellulosiruptor bescii]ACM60050.1 hypothetical protein Athe_0945 [Caldicellulosiruptor bescii DSM 6725]PBC87462.1 hypothetical protein B0S87_0373 [Caldicellulosiruptor bescii]PBC90395.1 hypothetical protein B0S89_0735 [Caldicellulosiruptor bescii]PBD04173.1 hypothetical protein B0S85_1804 [Caldicellulosiruptor bescii]PBD06192.1 hypothetical protein B0S90_1233 [Caldicellulosiruptor bescii]